MHGPTPDDNCPTYAGDRRRNRAPSRGDPEWTCDAIPIDHAAAHADRPIEYGAPLRVFAGPDKRNLARSEQEVQSKLNLS